MAVTSGFFNSVNHDRLYDAEQVSSIFDGIIVDGVYENYGDGLRTTAVSTADNTVSVGTGRAWFDHTWTLNDTPLTIQLEPANEMIKRIDAIVIDVDRTKEVRKNSIIYLKGPIVEGEAKPPTFLDEEFHKQYPIAYINRNPGATGPVSQSDIEYMVGTEKCPAVTGILEAQNLDALWIQLDAEFNEWWDGIRDLIGGDNPTLNLQTQIDNLWKYVKDKHEGANAQVGLLEKSVFDLFSSGNYNLNISSYDCSAVPGVGQTTNGTNVIHAFLPDGNLFNQTFGETRYNSPNTRTDKGGYVTWIKNKDGVNIAQRFDYATTRKIVDTVDDGTYYWDTYITTSNLIPNSETFSSYPIKLYLPIFYMALKCVSKYNGSYQQRKYYPQVRAQVMTLEISSDGVMRSSLSAISEGVAGNNYQETDNLIPIGHFSSIETVSGAKIYTMWDNQSIKNGKIDGYAFMKINKDGVLSIHSGNTTTNAISSPGWSYPGYPLPIGKEGYAIVAPYDLSSINSLTQNQKLPAIKTDTTKWIKIDETTLEGTIENADLASLDFKYYNNYPVETYSLSEKDGVLISHRDVGDPITTTAESSKYRSYFTGATNRDGGLPEGGYLAFENSDNKMLLGLGPNNSQIAIGSNGGAAILKNGISGSVGTFDINNTGTVYKHSINISDLKGYISGNNVTLLRKE